MPRKVVNSLAAVQMHLQPPFNGVALSLLLFNQFLHYPVAITEFHFNKIETIIPIDQVVRQLIRG